MRTLRFLVGATLLLGACEALWAPFQGPNGAFCDPESVACNTFGDGGSPDADVSDAAVSDSAVSDDAAPPDFAQSPDMVCNPGGPAVWLADAVPPSAAAVTLTGITGNGAGDLWT